MDRVAPSQGKPRPRLVVSLTTIPSRLTQPRIIQVLQSIHNQTLKPDALYLGLPRFCVKTKTPYPATPPAIKRLCKTIPIPNDYGPVTKIAAGLIAEGDPDTIIVTCDDDTVYPPTLLSELSDRAQRFPQAAIGSASIYLGSFPCYLGFATVATQGHKTGPLGLLHKARQFWDLPLSPDQPRQADILCGFPGVAYRRSFFPGSFVHFIRDFLDQAISNRDTRLNDDVTLSGFISRQNIPRLAFALTPVQNQSGPDALNASALTFIPSFLRAVRQCQNWGMFKVTAPLSLSERFLHTSTGPLIIALVILCFIFILKRSRVQAQNILIQQ